MIELPTDLPADVVPLSWLLGVWEGTGVIAYEASGHSFSGEFAHRVSFSHDGGDFVNYSSSAWLAASEGDEPTTLISELGYWRISRAQTDADPGPALLPSVERGAARTVDDVEQLRNAAGGFDVQASIVHSDGTTEFYLGAVNGPRIDLATDAILRPAGAKSYGAASRMYGLVDGHLLWAWDIAALGQELASHASARLAKAE